MDKQDDVMQDGFKLGMLYLDEVELKIKNTFGDDIAVKNVELLVQRGGSFLPQELGSLTEKLKNKIDMAKKWFYDYQPGSGGDYQPGLGRAAFLLGWISGLSTNLEEAVTHYEEALQYGYNESETLFRISSLYCHYLDKPSKAIPYLQKLLETEGRKNIPDMPGWIYFQLGRAYGDMGNKEKATESFNKVIEIEGATSDLGFKASKSIDSLKSSQGVGSKKLGKICDLCAKPISESEMEIISLPEMKQAVQRGWRPPTDDPIAMSGKAHGLSDSELGDEFYQYVMNDSSDWGLCSSCAKDFKNENKSIQSFSSGKIKATSSIEKKSSGSPITRLFDLFKPRWKHSDPKIRLAVMETITDPNILAKMAKHDDDSEIRDKAIDKITDQNILAELAQNSDVSIGVRKLAFRKVTDQVVLANVALTDEDHFVRLEAIDLITDQNVLADIARNVTDMYIKISVSRRLTDKSIVAELSLNLFSDFNVDRNVTATLDELLERLDHLLEQKWKALAAPGVRWSNMEFPITPISTIDLDLSKVDINLKKLEPHASWILIERISTAPPHSKVRNRAERGLIRLMGDDKGNVGDPVFLEKWWLETHQKTVK